MSEKKSYVCGVTVFKDGLEKHPEDVDKVKQYLKDQLSQKAIDEMDAGEYVISLYDVRRFDVPVPYDDQVDFKQKLIVQPLVRCKDCRHFYRDDIEEHTPYGFYNTYFHAFCDKHWDKEQGEYIDVDTDDFCAWAERRTDE